MSHIARATKRGWGFKVFHCGTGVFAGLHHPVGGGSCKAKTQKRTWQKTKNAELEGETPLAPHIANFCTLTPHLTTMPTIGIRREDKPREMRAPLSPTHVAELAASGLRVIVQPSSQRVYLDTEYAAAGAELREDLEDADCVLGVKEVPPQKLLPGRTMLFFARALKPEVLFISAAAQPTPPPCPCTLRLPQMCTRHRMRACRCSMPCWKSGCAWWTMCVRPNLFLKTLLFGF